MSKISALARFAAFLWIGLLAPTRSEAQFPGCPAIEQITLEECETLKKLFEDTQGAGWLNNREWLRSIQPCDWFGITCASSAWPRRITKIDLSGNNLTGSLPGELSLLTELRELKVDNTGGGLRFKKLTGSIPAVLGMLANLELLLLGNNLMVGAIPMELGDLSNLRALDLADNQLTGPIPAALGRLAALEELDLSGNMLAGTVPDALGELPALRLLLLNDNMLSGALPDSLGGSR